MTTTGRPSSHRGLVADAHAPNTGGRGFRPRSRRRARIAGGVALAATAVGGNVLIYSSLDDRTEVVQVVSDVRAGDLITAESLRVVAVDLDATVPVVRADEIDLVLDHYARVHLASGTLVAPVLVQGSPLVAEGSSVVAIELRPTRVPDGVRERSQLELIVRSDDEAPAFRTSGRVVTRPAAAEDVSGVLTMSVELPAADAEVVAAADEVRIVLLDPANDPVYDPGGGG